MDFISELKKIVGDERVLTDEAALRVAGKDYIGFRQYERADGKNFAPLAACVVKPQNTNDVSRVLKFLNENKIDVAPRTGGSSVTLGVEPQPGGVILDGSDMNGIIDFCDYDMEVTVKCGTPLEYLENYLNEKGFTAGHFPQSLPMAHVGGLIATRSIGQLSTLYGGIEDLVVGLEAVLADGEVIRIKSSPRRSVGPDLRHLFIGCEGSMGFITEATLKIFKYTPETRWMRAYGVRGMQNGLNLIREIMVEGFKPAVVRLHDETEVQTVFGGTIAPEGYCLLLFLAEGPRSITAANGEFIEAVVKKYDTVDLGEKPVLAWLKTRNDVCYHMDEPRYYNMGLIADTCEISAPWSEIGKIHEAVVTRLPREIPTLAAVGGHSSHSYVQGTNIYFTFGFGVKDAASAQAEYMKLVGVIMEETLKRGGSVAHHHGSGKYRTQWMPQEHGSSYQLLYRLKNALDPNRVLNKGVLLVD